MSREGPKVGPHLTFDEQRNEVSNSSLTKPLEAPLRRSLEVSFGQGGPASLSKARDHGPQLAFRARHGRRSPLSHARLPVVSPVLHYP